jgi:zinc/manganese transport system substrate-binding protein
MVRRILTITIAGMLLSSLARAADRIPVIATFSVIGDMLVNVGGDHLDIKTIVGPGGDCELYQPTAADVATVAGARAIFINDLNEEFEPWLEPLLKQARFTGEKHYLSDVLVGSAMGYGIGRYVYHAHHRQTSADSGDEDESRARSRAWPLIAPQYDRHARAYGAALAWSF